MTKACFIIFLFSYTAISQDIDSLKTANETKQNFIREWTSTNNLMSLEYGISKYPIDVINREIQKNWNKSFSEYLGSMKASASFSFLINRKVNIDSHFEYAFFNSFPSAMNVSDSLRLSAGGFYFGLDACKDLLPKHKNVDFLVGFGTNAGRVVLRHYWKKENDETYDEVKHNRYRNPFFSPKLSFEPRIFLFKHLSISIRAELLFDVTSRQWKIKNDSMNQLGGFAATGYNLHLTLGWRD